MKTALKFLLAAGAALMASQAGAVPIFTDNFDTENGGVGVLSYSGFANWTVSPGTVDLIGTGMYDLYPGNGLYIDLDGTTNAAGTMTSRAIALEAGSYELSFTLGGNARGGADDAVNVSVSSGYAFQSYVLGSTAPLASHTLAFTVGSAAMVNLIFQHLGGDNTGMILDNVQLNAVSPKVPNVPDRGPTALLLGLSVFALGWIRRAMK